MYVKKSVPGEQFSRLTEALRDMGVPENTLRIMREYLDPGKDRDNSLLDQITPLDLSRVVYYTYPMTQNLEKAIQKEINHLKNTELYERYILFCDALAGVYCMKLRVMSLSESYLDIEAMMTKALRTRYGNQAEARTFAILITYHLGDASSTIYYYHLRDYIRLHANSKQDPAVVLDAIEFVEDHRLKLCLILSALHCANLRSEKLFGKPSAKLKGRLLGTFDELSQEKVTDPEIVRVLFTAIAEASCLDAQYLQVLEQTISKNPVVLDKLADFILSVFQENSVYLLQQLHQLSITTVNYISMLTDNRYLEKHEDKLLKQLAEKFPAEFRTQIMNEESCVTAERMKKIYLSVHPGKALPDGSDPQESAKRRCLEVYTVNPNVKTVDDKAKIRAYLLGECDTEEFLTILPGLEKNYYGTKTVRYAKAYGMDEFAERCICCCALLCSNIRYSMNSVIGFDIETHEKEFVNILIKHKMPLELILNSCAEIASDYYTEAKKEEFRGRFCKVFADKDRLAELAVLTGNTGKEIYKLTADARCLLVRILGENGKYQYMTELFAMTGDSSKQVRALLIDYLPKPSDPCNSRILELLQAKKIAQREIAISLLEKKCPDCWKKHVQKAFEIEKSDKLKIRLGALLGEDVPGVAGGISGTPGQVSLDDLVNSLTKGAKFRKADWLLKDKPCKPVYFKNNLNNLNNSENPEKSEKLEVPERYLRAILNCYMDMPTGDYQRSPQADQLADALMPGDLERFAQEIFTRWIEAGADAKRKWVLYFTAIHGGSDAIQTIQHYIKEWAEHSRSAIAGEAVRAIACNGSSPALMLVDTMARKFKNRQVRSMANLALQQSADVLGITREELADRIVPDLGLNQNLCRIFDYGTRKFEVYLTPALELEIFESESQKKFKNLPKPGAKDDPELSAQAVREFKDMKKQMKTAIQSQKSRLEYALLCERKWTVPAWQDLFIRKPVMHCFAIGLIWGVYQGQELIQTFRYTEDGSFNTSDSDEYTFPDDPAILESLRIGLVHPVEITPELIAEWNEQLADYEIIQPFAQLNRKVYRILPEETGKHTVQRFSGNELGGVTLAGKMLKMDWRKGMALDAGEFCEFTREDIAEQSRTADGKIRQTGYYIELSFSGMYIQISYDDNEDVTIGELKFWSLSEPVRRDNPLRLEQISPRYFSEIILQLTSIFGENSEHDEK